MHNNEENPLASLEKQPWKSSSQIWFKLLRKKMVFIAYILPLTMDSKISMETSLYKEAYLMIESCVVLQIFSNEWISHSYKIINILKYHIEASHIMDDTSKLHFLYSCIPDRSSLIPLIILVRTNTNNIFLSLHIHFSCHKTLT